jgi:hypothetical protein
LALLGSDKYLVNLYIVMKYRRDVL